MNKYMIDTSAWIEFALGTEVGSFVCGLVEANEAKLSIISIAEFSSWLADGKVDVVEQLDFVERNAEILPLSVEAARKLGPLRQAQRKKHPSFGTADALIYLTAQEHGLVLLTKDYDFSGLDGVELL